jgi:exocyst complex protein 7
MPLLISLHSLQPGQIGVYMDNLERLNANIAFKASAGDLDRTVSGSAC